MTNAREEPCQNSRRLLRSGLTDLPVCVCVTGEPSLRWSWPRRRGPGGWWPSSASPRRRWRARRTASRMRSQSCTSESVFEISSPLNLAADKTWCHAKWWDNKLFCRACHKKNLCMFVPRLPASEIQDSRFRNVNFSSLYPHYCIMEVVSHYWISYVYDIRSCMIYAVVMGSVSYASYQSSCPYRIVFQ